MSTFTVSLTVLYNGDGQIPPCNMFQTISCISLPPWAEKKWWYCDSCASATGELRINYELGQYDKLYLYCPDGVENINIDLDEEDYTSDKAVIQKKLPQYCREYCTNI